MAKSFEQIRQGKEHRDEAIRETLTALLDKQQKSNYE
jgi:hypothetical protein